MISTIGGDRSGYASTGNRLSDHVPVSTSSKTARITRNRCRSDDAIMRFITEAERRGPSGHGSSGALTGLA
jgi:hypothetical protein